MSEILVDGVRRSPEKHCQNIKSPSTLKLRRAKVEPEGVEPSSKQGTDRLSTCLSCYWLSELAREEAPKTKTYSLYLIRKQGLPPDQPDLCLRPVIRPESGRSICGTSRPATRAGLSQSTKLRLGCECEFVIANCSVAKSFYGTAHIARHAYVPTHLAVKTKATPSG